MSLSKGNRRITESYGWKEEPKPAGYLNPYTFRGLKLDTQAGKLGAGFLCKNLDLVITKENCGCSLNSLQQMTWKKVFSGLFHTTLLD